MEPLAVEVLAAYPHDPTAFTQGLIWDGGTLYESTGLYGRSTLRRVDPSDGRVLAQSFLDSNFYGTGVARRGDRLIQLTWKAGVAFVYDLARLEVVDEHGFNGEGWGLAGAGEQLAMSNGSSRLTLRNPDDFRWRQTLEVTLEGEPFAGLDELEQVGDHLYANVRDAARVVRIDLATGQVDATIDVSGLLDPAIATMVGGLSGLAHDPLSDSFWLTGKFWPTLFRVRFAPPAAT